MGSLFAILNHCKTRMGSRLLEAWLRQPLVDKAAIEERYDLVGLFKDEMQLRGQLQDTLKTAPDVEQIVAKLRRTRANLQDVYRLYRFSISTLPAFIDILGGWVDASEDAVPNNVSAVLKDKHLCALRQADADFANVRLVEFFAVSAPLVHCGRLAALSALYGHCPSREMVGGWLTSRV